MDKANQPVITLTGINGLLGENASSENGYEYDERSDAKHISLDATR